MISVREVEPLLISHLQAQNQGGTGNDVASPHSDDTIRGGGAADSSSGAEQAGTTYSAVPTLPSAPEIPQMRASSLRERSPETTTGQSSFHVVLRPVTRKDFMEALKSVTRSHDSFDIMEDEGQT